MPGWENQGIGDAGQSLVQAELATRGFLIGPLLPDPGEDFWIEQEGRRAIAEGSFPSRALLQVKATSSVDGATFVDDIPLKQIVRWASQPLPVFIVGVTTTPPSAFYAKSIDDIVTDDLKGRDPTTLTAKTVRVRLPLVADLSTLLAKTVQEHHRSMRLVLDGLSETEIEQHYFEVLEKKNPEGWERVPIAGWRVLWKSEPRPQHFAAMLTELARRAGPEYGKTVPRPAYVIFHVYRSLHDMQLNLAVARVDWVDPTHPKAARIAEFLKAVGGFNVRHDKDVAAFREIFRAKMATAEDFALYAEKVGTAFDQITDAILAGPGVVEAWNASLRQQFNDADTFWNEGPLPPVQQTALNEALTVYYRTLLEHEVVAIYRRDKLAPEVTARLLRQSEAKLRDYRGSWRVFVRPRL
jgi:hypothetical protein